MRATQQTCAPRNRHARHATPQGRQPWAQPPLLWWNFVGREPAEMQTWAADWAQEDGGRFGAVAGYVGPRLAVPPVPALRRL